MKYFIFQAVPDRMDLAREIIPGKSETWYATRYRNEMQPGAVAFFWQSGNPSTRGIYGWGVLTSSAYKKPAWDSYGVDVQYRVRFGIPLLAAKLEQEPAVRGMLILRAPQATNFLLTEQEARSIVRLIHRLGEEAP